ncbi:MAG: hypothetical protein K0B87_02130 [Candidatus Syntrophosphaera sp.]|nr:hypothetical protein [Candidatus Syntrophosphaera sp.]
MNRVIVICLALLICGGLFAAEYTVGAGTETINRVPVNGMNDYGWTKTLYTKPELNAAGLNTPGEIIGVGFYVGNLPANYTIQDQHVFLRHSNLESYTQPSEALPDSSLFTQVYAGDLFFHGNGWLQVVFSSAFAWDNENNIEILWKNWDGSGQSGNPVFRSTSSSPLYQAVYNHANGAFPTGTGTKYYYRPNLQVITAMAPLPAITVYPFYNGLFMPGAALAWKNGGGCPTSYDVYLGTANPPSTLVSSGQTGTFFTPQLQPGSTYYWRVVPSNSYGSAGACPVWILHTPAAVQLAESFEGDAFPPPGWLNPGNLEQSQIYPYQGEKCLFKSAGTSGSLIGTPLLSFNSSSVLSFYARTGSTAGNSRIRLKYSIDGVNWTNSGVDFEMPTTLDWVSYEVFLGSLAGQNLHLGLEPYNAASSGLVSIYIDHVVGPVPAVYLAAPQLSIDIIGASAVLNWTMVPAATGYRIYASDDPANWGSTPLATVGPSVLSYSMPLLTRKFYRVTAIMGY